MTDLLNSIDEAMQTENLSTQTWHNFRVQEDMVFGILLGRST